MESSMDNGKKEWAGTTFGNQWMHRNLIASLRYMDVRLLYAFAYVFIVPVCLVLNPSCGIIYRYFRQRFGYSPLRSFWKTYVNHCRFSEVVIDKFAMFAGKRFRVDVDGREVFDRLETAEAGFMQFSSHIGSFEMAGYSLRTKKKRMNALVFGGEKATVMAERSKLFAGGHIRMIPVRGDMSHLFEINNALAGNEIVSMPADRVFGSPKTITASFLGKDAKFPLGPFQTATMRSLDVVAINVMKTSVKGYTAFVTPLRYDKAAPRREQIRQLAASYVAELERMVKRYPTQWYNYFEFWD